MEGRFSQPDLVRWVRDTAAQANGLLVPVSGGSDSALCYWLCTEAFGDQTLGVHAGPDLRYRSWFESRGRVEVIPTAAGRTVREREVQRWAVMLDLGLTQLRWLVSSRNRTEDVFGTYGLASRLATILPLIGVWKSEVMELYRYAGVPGEILESSRRPDPVCDRAAAVAEIPLELIDHFVRVKAGDLPEVGFVPGPGGVSGSRLPVQPVQESAPVAGALALKTCNRGRRPQTLVMFARLGACGRPNRSGRPAPTP